MTKAMLTAQTALEALISALPAAALVSQRVSMGAFADLAVPELAFLRRL